MRHTNLATWIKLEIPLHPDNELRRRSRDFRCLSCLTFKLWQCFVMKDFCWFESFLCGKETQGFRSILFYPQCVDSWWRHDKTLFYDDHIDFISDLLKKYMHRMVKRFFSPVSCRIYPCFGLNLDFSPIPPSLQSVVRQSRLQLVRSVRGAPQGPSRPALLHPPPQLRVATVGRDPKQHSGEYPAQSSLIWLHRWVHAQHTHTHARARDTCVPFFLQMPVYSYLSISLPIKRAGTYMPKTTKMMNFLSSACTVTLSVCSEALQCTPKLHILSRGRRRRRRRQGVAVGT